MRLVIAVLFLMATHSLCFASDLDDPPVAGSPSTTVVELQAPVGSAIKVDGRDMGMMTSATREIEYKDRKTGKEFPSVLEAIFEDKSTTRKMISLVPGQRVKVVIERPDVRRPEIVVQTGHSERIISISFSPDGGQVLTGSNDNRVILWDVESAQQLRTFPTVDKPKTLAFSADAQSVLAVGYDGTRIWNRTNGEEVERLTDLNDFVAFSPDGRFLGWATFSAFGLWDLVTKKSVHAEKLDKLKEGLHADCGAWSPNGSLLAIGGGSFGKPHGVVVWEHTTKRKVFSLDNQFKRISALAFSPDGKLLVTASGDYEEPGQIMVWDAQTGRLEREFKNIPSRPISLDISFDGARLLTVASGAAIVYDFASGKQVLRIAHQNGEEPFSVDCAAFSPDGERIATGGSPNQAIIWDAVTGRPQQRLRGRVQENKAVAASPDGRILAVAAGETICLWEVATGSLTSVLQGHGSNVTSVAFSADSRWLASASDDHTANVWEVETGKLRVPIGNPASRDVAFINGGREFLLAGTSRITVWDTNTRRLLRSLPIEPQGYSVETHGDDGRFLVVSRGSSRHSAGVALWDADAARRLRTIEAEGFVISGAMFDLRRERIIASGSRGDNNGAKDVTVSKRDQILVWEADGTNRLVCEAAPGQEIAALALSRDGEKLAACVREPEQPGGVHVWNTASFNEERTLDAHKQLVDKLRFSSDGTKLAATCGKFSDDGDVIVWNLDDGDTMRRLAGRFGHVSRLAFTPDGKRLVTAGGGSDRAELLIWDLASGRQLRALRGHKSDVNGLDCSPDGQYLLSKDSGTTILWDLANGAQLQTWKGHSGDVNTVAFSPDAKHLISGGGPSNAPGELFLWNLPEGSLAAEYSGAVAPYTHAAFSSDGTKIVAGAQQTDGPDVAEKRGNSVNTRKTSLGDTVFVWDARSGRKLNSWKRDGSWTLDGDEAVTFDPFGKRILTSKGFVIDTETGRTMMSPPGHEYHVIRAAISRDGRWAVTSSWKKDAVIWDCNAGRQVRKIVRQSAKIEDVAISPDGRRVATTSDDGTAIIWSLVTGAKLATLAGHKGRVTCVAFSPDGARLATGGFDSRVVLWDTASGRRLDTVIQSGWNVRSLAFSPSGRRLVTGHGDNLAYITDIASRKRVTTLPGHTGIIYCVAYSPDGKWVFTGGDNGEGFLWDAQALRGVHRLANVGYAISAAFSRDSRTLLVGTNTTVGLYDVATGKENARKFFQGSGNAIVAAATGGDRFIAAHERDITIFEQSTMSRVTAMRSPGRLSTASFSDSGDRVLYGSHSGRLALCDSQSGNDIQWFDGHSADVRGAVVLPDGRHIVSASDDGSAAIWDAATGDMLLRLVTLDNGHDWLAMTPTGLFDGSAGGRASVKVRTSGGLDLEPIERFFQDFYRPGLLAEVVRGERPLPKGDFASRIAPIVKITSPRQGSTITDAIVTVDAKVTDRGGGIQGPWIMQNGSRVLAEGERHVAGDTVGQSFVLPLVRGENRFEVRAASGDGSWESEPATLVLMYEQPVARPSVHLVAVGINKYAEGSLNLRYAIDDARAMEELFRRRGPELYGPDGVHVTTLVDEKATKAGIEEALSQVARDAKAQDTLVVFLSGHGTTLGQRYYFIPHDFRKQEDGYEEDVRRHGLASDALGDLMARVPALKRVVILDTCQAGGALPGNITVRDPFAFRGALERLSRSQGVFTIAATAASGQAHEVEQLKHGMLTYALLAALGDIENGPLVGQAMQPTGDAKVAEVRDWLAFAQDKVPLLTKLYLGQEQFVSFSGQGASFPILPIGGDR